MVLGKEIMQQAPLILNYASSIAGQEHEGIIRSIKRALHIRKKQVGERTLEIAGGYEGSER